MTNHAILVIPNLPKVGEGSLATLGMTNHAILVIPNLPKVGEDPSLRSG